MAISTLQPEEITSFVVQFLLAAPVLAVHLLGRVVPHEEEVRSRVAEMQKGLRQRKLRSLQRAAEKMLRTARISSDDIYVELGSEDDPSAICDTFFEHWCELTEDELHIALVHGIYKRGYRLLWFWLFGAIALAISTFALPGLSAIFGAAGSTLFLVECLLIIEIRKHGNWILDECLKAKYGITE